MRNDSVYSSMALEPLRSALSIGEVGETSLALPSDRGARSAQQRVLEQVSTMKRSKSKYGSSGGGGGGKAGGTGTLSPTSPQSDSVFYEYKFTPSALNGSAFMNENSMTNGHAKAAKQSQSFVQRTISTRTASSQKNLSNMFPSSPTAVSYSRGGQEGFAGFRSLEMSSPPAVSAGNARLSQTFRQTNRVKRNSSHGALNSSSQIIGNGFGNGLGSGQIFGNGHGNGQIIGSGQIIGNGHGNGQIIGNGHGSGQIIGNGHGNGQIIGSGQMFGNSQIIGNGTVHRNSSSSNQITTSQIISRRPPSTHSNPEGVKASVASRSKSEIGINGETRSTDLTISEAVDCLLSQDESYQLCGASFIQHTTFTDDKAKQEVLKMKGINPLVSLMSSPNPQIQMTAASALRNLVFRDSANKEEVQRCGGIGQAVQLLKSTDSAETQKHVTGLLWNLSSADNLKPELLRSALPVLTETVLEPFAASTDHGANADQDETFYNTTGCLRNLSSGKLGSRQAMRNCKGLVDSLVSYVQNSVDSGNPDDKSVENCVCILHNLTYQLESESPAIFSKMNALAGYNNRRANTTDTGPIGCFSSQSRKIQQENHFDYPVMEDNNPKGQSWLIHSQALQSYLSLLGTSQSEATQEACCGALHNLTANKGIVSDVLSQTIVQKLNGLQHISPMLQSSSPELRNSVTSLLGNLSRTPRLQSIMARQALPQLVRTLNSQGADLSPESDSTIATTCHTINNLLRAEPEMSKQLLSNTLINSLNDISQNIALPKASKAAGVLLHSLWSDKNIQSFLKKQGMNKKAFVNDVTSAAVKSVQVIE